MQIAVSNRQQKEAMNQTGTTEEECCKICLLRFPGGGSLLHSVERPHCYRIHTCGFKKMISTGILYICKYVNVCKYICKYCKYSICKYSTYICKYYTAGSQMTEHSVVKSRTGPERNWYTVW